MAIFKSDCQNSWNKYDQAERIGKILPKSTPLRIATIAGSYKDLIHLNNNNGGLSSIIKNLYDGSGNDVGIKSSVNSTSINSENTEVSNPVNGSNLYFVKKIELNTTNEIVHNIIESNHIMLSYSGSEYNIEKNITINLDGLFSYQSSQLDEFITTFIHIHCISNSFLPMSLSFNFSLGDYNLQSSLFSLNEEKTFFTKSFIIMANKLLTEKIEIMELENAELA